MLVKSKLADFRERAGHVSRYREAIQMLREAGVDQVLLELAAPEPINPNSPNAGTAALAALYESLGFQRCLNALFSLDEQHFGTGERPIADFGATEKLGITDKQARDYSGV